MDKGLARLQNLYPHIDIVFAHQTLFTQRGEDFPFELLDTALKEKREQYDYMLFLNGLGGPAQEIRTQQHNKKLK